MKHLKTFESSDNLSLNGLTKLEISLLQDGLTLYISKYPNSSQKENLKKLKDKITKQTGKTGASDIDYID